MPWGPEGRSGGISGSGRASTASIVRLSIGKSGPVGTEVLAPGRSAFANGQMSWGEVAFDADLLANVLGDLARALTLHAGDVRSKGPPAVT